jgi:GNAT superfamily N-acetyltransferase
MIRQVKIEEIPKVVWFMKEFEKESKFVTVKPEYAIPLWEKTISTGIGTMFILEEGGEMIGGIGGFKSPIPHSGEMTAVETFWFVTPKKRGRGIGLLNAFECWAKEQGCKKIAMIHLADSFSDRLEKFYLRYGYELVEKHYIKEIMQ